MWFGILGEIRADHEGQVIALGRPQERCLLGLLLIETGRTVPVDRLADLLWDGEPPGSDRSTIQTYIARLRAALGDYGVQIVTSGGGYRIDVPAENIDLHDFRRRLACAREVPDPAARAVALAGALELWRGPLLGGAASDRLRMRIGSAYDEMRLAAIAECAEAETASGRPDRAVERLVEIVAAHPVREDLVGLLMSAYAAAGRKAEALDTYRRTRQRLVEDLGLEPSGALRARHEAILRSEPAESLAPVTVLVEPVRPRELPPPVAAFTGRRLELAQLTDFLRSGPASGPPVVILHGRGGVGKSALAVQAGHQVAADFPDGQLYLDLRGSTLGQRARTPMEALSQALRSLGMSEHDLPSYEAEAAARLRTLTSDRKLLIVLDNAADPSVVRPLIPASDGCAVIITSRTALGALDATRRVAIDGLADADAFRLLVHVAGRRGRRGADHDRIIELCEKLPLALRIAASRLSDASQLSVADLADQLDGQRRLDVLDAGGLAVRSSIGVSYDALRGADGAGSPGDQFAAWLFLRLVLVPVADLTPAFAAALAGQTELRPAKAALARLADLHLLQVQAAGRYRLHDLIRLFALEHAGQVPAPDRDEAIGRALDLYLASAQRVHQVLLPTREVPGAPIKRQDLPPTELDSMAEANAWLDAELPNLLAAAQFAAQTEYAPLFPLQLSNSLHLVLGKRAEWSAERQLAELAVAATRRGSRDHIEAVRALGQAELHAGNFTDASSQLAEAVELSRAAGERRLMLAALLDLGRVALQSGEHALALSRMTECLEVAREEGWVMPEAITLLNISSVHVAERRWDEAREALLASLRVRREHGDMAGLSIVLPALGYVEFELGDRPRALELLAEGQQACRTVGNDVDGWFAAFCRSVVLLTTGLVRPALRDAAAALRACVAGRRYEIACTLELLAAVFAAAGKSDLAADYQRRARAAGAAYSGRAIPSVESLLARLRTGDHRTGHWPR